MKLEDRDLDDFGTALHSSFFLLPDISCSFLVSGSRLNASRLKIQSVFSESQAWTELRQYHVHAPVLCLVPGEGKLLLQLGSCSGKEIGLLTWSPIPSPQGQRISMRVFSEIPTSRKWILTCQI